MRKQKLSIFTRGNKIKNLGKQKKILLLGKRNTDIYSLAESKTEYFNYKNTKFGMVCLVGATYCL